MILSLPRSSYHICYGPFPLACATYGHDDKPALKGGGQSSPPFLGTTIAHGIAGSSYKRRHRSFRDNGRISDSLSDSLVDSRNSRCHC